MALWEELTPAWRACVEEAWDAYRAGSLPIGAAIADPADCILARGRNRIFESTAPAGLLAGSRLAHAEINALLALDWSAVDPRACVLYTTTEPCPLCVGAVRMTRVRQVRYAARDGAAGSVELFAATPYMRLGTVNVRGPLRADLEVLLIALHTEAILRGWGDGMAPPLERFVPWQPEVVVERLAANVPEGVALGRALLTRDVPRGLRDAGADARTMLEALSREAESAVRYG
jgi:tRNA(adenine34) deaminase